MAASNLDGGSTLTNAASINSASLTFSTGDVILVGVMRRASGGAAADFSVSHPDLSGWASASALGENTGGGAEDDFLKVWWTKATTGSSGSALTIASAHVDGVGLVAYTINKIPAADTTGTLVQAIDSKSQVGINGGSSPQTFSHTYPSTPLSSSTLFALWGNGSLQAADTIAPRSSPAWTEVDERSGGGGGQSALIEAQTYVGSDTQSDGFASTWFGGSGAPKIESLLMEFAGASSGTALPVFMNLQRQYRS